MRKHLYLLSILVPAVLQTNAQVYNPVQSQAINSSYIMSVNGKPWEEIKYYDIEGNPYLTEEWSLGNVKFAQEGYAKDMLLRLDLYNNKLYFKRHDTEYSFVWPVNEFRLRYKKNGDSSTFRNNYPSIDKNNQETFYEVLVDGKFQLLNYYSKVIQEYKPYNEPPKQRFVTKSLLYARLPDGKMIPIKNDKDDILAAMTQYANAVQKIIDNNNLKLKSDDHVKRLFTLLNQQQ